MKDVCGNTAPRPHSPGVVVVLITSTHERPPVVPAFRSRRLNCLSCRVDHRASVPTPATGGPSMPSAQIGQVWSKSWAIVGIQRAAV